MLIHWTVLDHALAPAAIREFSVSKVAARADELVYLQHAAWRMGAAMIGDDRIPQPSEVPADLMAAELTWHVVAEGDAVIAAVATSQCPDGRRDIERLVVAPCLPPPGPGQRARPLGERRSHAGCHGKGQRSRAAPLRAPEIPTRQRPRGPGAAGGQRL